MKIAICVDAEGRIASPYQAGTVALFENTQSGWRSAQSMPFAITAGMSLADVKAQVGRLVEALADCRVFVACEARGLLYTLLEDEFGYHSWRSQGVATEMLETIAAAEIARQAIQPPGTAAPSCQERAKGRRNCDEPFAPVAATPGAAVTMQDLGRGRRRIDLAGALRDHPDLNSRTILLPLLDAGNFARLEILCDHPPRWLADAVAVRALQLKVAPADSGLCIHVFPTPMEA